MLKKYDRDIFNTNHTGLQWLQNSVLVIILNNTDTIYYNTVFFKYYYGRNNSLINEPFNTSTNHFSSKDRHSKLRNVDLEHGHVYIVKYHNHKRLDIAKQLCATDNLFLGEAIHRDNFYGIGMPLTHKQATDKTKWQTNKLREILMAERVVQKTLLNL